MRTVMHLIFMALCCSLALADGARTRSREVALVKWTNTAHIASFRALNLYGAVVSRYNPIKNGDQIDLRFFPRGIVNFQANIRSSGSRKMRSMRMILNDGEYQRVARKAPYKLFEARTAALRGTLKPGKYGLAGIPYYRKNARGSSGVPFTVNFTIVDGGRLSQPTATPIPQPSSSATPNATPAPTPPPAIPALAEWRDKMITFGRNHCNRSTILSLTTWEGSIWYYDGMRVYQQIAEYLNDPSWLACASYVREVYAPYVLQNNGVIGGWRVFPHGLARDFALRNDNSSRQAVLALAANSAFAPSGGGADHELSRETAYIINAYIEAARVSGSPSPRLQQAVNFARGHIDQWAISRTAKYFKPFMVGLTMEALINYFNYSNDQTIPPLLGSLAQWLWSNGWDPVNQSFRYIVCRPGASTTVAECAQNNTGGQADLNQLIGPGFAWLYHMTGDARYQQWGDQIFQGGVQRAWLGNGKQFSQNYRWSFDYVKWRSLTPKRTGAASVAAANSPTGGAQ